MKLIFHSDVLIDCTHDWYFDEQEVSDIKFDDEANTATITYTDEYRQNKFSSEIASKLVELCYNGGKIVDTEGVGATGLYVTAADDKTYITIDFTE